jgi:uncharacterized protein
MLGYRVEGAPVIMVGSVHALPEQWIENLEAVLRALMAPMRRLMVEADLDTPVDLGFANLPDGTSLSDLLDPDLLRKSLLLAESLGLEEGRLLQSKPWWVALQLGIHQLVNAGFVPACGLDRIALNLAGEAVEEVSLIPLETLDSGLRYFDRASLSEQAEFLRLAVESPEKSFEEFQSLLRGWATGDASLIEQVLKARLDFLPGIFHPLVIERNNAWLPEIEALLQEETPSLIVVGVLHLVGEGGLVNLLSDAGHKLEPIWKRDA